MDTTNGLRIPTFPFDSPLASKAVALERLRGDLPRDTDHLPVLAELGDLYRLLSSIVSARIEGNHTTVVEAVDGAQRRRDEPQLPLSDSVEEILRLEEAAAFLDDALEPGSRITHKLVRDLHHLATHDLSREGDRTPGEYRTREVGINGSDHQPPLATTVHASMSSLLDFANAPADPHMQLIRMAIAHHRFVWIHPFSNGNGRVARLFSYAMIRAYGFAPNVEYQTVNPTTVFGSDRQRYYDRLAAADSLEDEALVEWADFVLGGLLRDMEAMRSLAQDGAFSGLVRGAIEGSRRAAQLDDADARALSIIAHGGPFKAGDLEDAVGMSPSGRSRLVNSLLERRLIRRVADGRRAYRIRLSPNGLTPFLFTELDRRGLLPEIARDEVR